MEELGIHLEVFGDHTFVCRELPVWMNDVEEEAFLLDMIDIWERDKALSLEKLRKHSYRKRWHVIAPFDLIAV